MANDFRSINFAAAERVKRDPSLQYSEAVKDVIADCLMKNDDPGYVPAGAFMDWNWRRLDCYKIARGEPGAVPVRDILRSQAPRNLTKAA